MAQVERTAMAVAWVGTARVVAMAGANPAGMATATATVMGTVTAAARAGVRRPEEERSPAPAAIQMLEIRAVAASQAQIKAGIRPRAIPAGALAPAIAPGDDRAVVKSRLRVVRTPDAAKQHFAGFACEPAFNKAIIVDCLSA